MTMRTDLTQACRIALISCLIVSLVATPADSARKCRGPWAIHACFGGNGKRSDPSLSPVGESSLLRQYLLRELPSFPLGEDGERVVEVPAEPLSVDVGALSSSDYPQYFVSPAVDRLSALLRTLRTLQKENEALP